MSAAGFLTLEKMTPQGRLLAELLPAALINADAEQPGRPLLRLLEVLAAPLAALEHAVERLDADPFVALASPEALPLLAELVGARLLGEDVVTNRRVVAGSVGWRRRKGTRATLETVLTQTSGWAAEVDEGFRSLLVTQDITTVLPSRGWTTLLWDPVALSDPLTRRVRRHERHPSPALEGPAAGEDVEATLRRLGSADALRLPASALTVDLAGWARPDGAVIRTSRVAVAERDRVVLGPAEALATTAGGSAVGLRLDPGGRDAPLAGRVLAEAVPATLGLAPVHETPSPKPAPRRPELLTPTDLAADPDAVEQGDALSLLIDGVPLLGRDAADVAGPLAYEPPGDAAPLRFADGGRPAPGESWTLGVVAITAPTQLAATALADDPPTDPDGPNPLALTARVSAVSATREPTAASAIPIAGAQIGLRVVRSRGINATWRRAADGTWSRRAVPAPAGVAVSGDTALRLGGQDVVARLVRDGDALAVATLVLGAAAWRRVPLVPADGGGPAPALELLQPGPATVLAADGEDLLLVAPRDDDTLGAWRLHDLADAEGHMTVLDEGAARHPPLRAAAASCLTGGALLLHGGQRDGHPLRDLWQLDLAGAPADRWVRRPVRDQVARSGGQLLADGQALIRIGGAGEAAGLSVEAARIDLSATRPRWRPLPDLPLADGLPGTMHAHLTPAGAVEALVWADRTRPRFLRLPPGAPAWEIGAPELDAPNPPAEGEILTVAGEVHVTGPPPLPPSEVVVPVGGRGHLAFLPPLDPQPSGQAQLVLLDRSSSSERWYPPGEPALPSLRLGRNRDPNPILRREAPAAPRVGAAGRLRWVPLTVRQAVLDAWEQPLALHLEDRVLLDPRLGRAVVHPDLAGVQPSGSRATFSASYHVARGAALGAGFVPPGAAIPSRWQEPPDSNDPNRFVLPTPPEQPDRDGVTVPPSAAVGPPGRRWGPNGESAVDTRLEDALERLAGLPATQPRVLGVIGSPHLPASTGVLTEGAITSVVARDRGGYPFVAAADDGVSLSLLERPDPDGRHDVGPHLFLTGLAFGGALELAMTTAEVDLRWCDLGLAPPSAEAGVEGLFGVGVRVAGAGRDTGLLRATPLATTLTLRLHGCQVARLEAPPWVQVIAAGCTFDAGARSAVAIAAAGAMLRLRDCTVRGAVHAGVLEASSCAFAGPLHCDRPDLGWLRRCVTSPGADRPPRSWRGVEADVSFADVRPAWPRYLVLDDNNGDDVLTAGEGGTPPGAHADRGRALRELTERTGDFLPLGLHPHHRDRTGDDTYRMGRSHA